MTSVKDKMEKIFESKDPWNDSGSEYSEIKFLRQIEYLDRLKPKKVMEIGCGEGIMTYLMGNKSYQVDAVDISLRAIKRAKQRCKRFKNIFFYRSDATDFSPSKKYDVILISEVMSYIVWLKTVLEMGSWFVKLSNSLENKGKIIITNTISIKDAKSGKDVIEYFTWVRYAYFAILRDLGFRIISRKVYSGVKNNQNRKYEIVIFAKDGKTNHKGDNK